MTSWRHQTSWDNSASATSTAFSRLLLGVAGAKFEKAMLKMTDAFEARAKMLADSQGSTLVP